MARRTANNGWGKKWRRRSKKIARQGARGAVSVETMPELRNRWKSPQERQEARTGGVDMRLPEPVAWDEHGEPTEWVLSRDEHGNPTGKMYRETTAQRDRRLREAAAELGGRINWTPGMEETLRRARQPRSD